MVALDVSESSVRVYGFSERLLQAFIQKQPKGIFKNMNMLKEKRSLNKLILSAVTAFAVLITFFGLGLTGVYAFEAQTVQLKDGGNEAEIILTFPEAAKEEIASLQISLSVSVSSDNANVEFVPGDGLKAKIAEGRYSRESGILNIYASGTEPLFDKTNPVLSLGLVRITGFGCYADVKLVEKSLKFVRGTELVVQDTGVEYSGDIVRISAYEEDTPTGTTEPGYTGNYGGGGFIAPEVTTVTDASVTEAETVTAEATTTAAPEVTSAPSAGNIEDVTKPDENIPAIPVEGDSISAAAAEKLSEAVSRAETYKRADYTADSYQFLDEALGRARELLADRESRQEEINEALLMIENAIGMLVPASFPSRADAVTDSEESHIVSEDAADGSAVPDVSSESGTTTLLENETKPVSVDTVPDSTSGGSPDTSESITEQGADTAGTTPDNPEPSYVSSEKGLNVWVIVLAVLGVVVAVTAAAAVISENKKKTSRKTGNHSKAKSAEPRGRDDEDK